MLADIAPGSRVNVKIVKEPTSQAARKTLVRVLSRSTAVKAENARLRRARKDHHREAQRGGRMWQINVPRQPVLTGARGEEQTVVATLDVLTDLKSVERFVEVTKA